MTIYRITSTEYRPYFVEGPDDANLEELEEEYGDDGSAPEFVLWLLDNKGFRPLATTEYSFNQG